MDDSQARYIPPLLADVRDVDEDKPVGGRALVTAGFQLPYLIFGAATLGHHYHEESFLNSDRPLRAIRLALRYGICCFDTAPHYGSSEIILGSILRSLDAEFPRSSYRLITKAGRYGTEFDYSPTTVRASVLSSLSRLGTDHLDAVYMHDVEYIATPVRSGSTAGNHLRALEEPTKWGLEAGDEAKILGEGDQQVLDAIGELWKMKEQGMIKAVGISGYPLPVLLRLALLVLHNPPYKPLDILLSYSHYTLQNGIFPAFLPQFLHRARIAHIACASPFSMGLLTPKHPSWHPAPAGMIAAKEQAAALERNWEGGLANLALGFSLRMGVQGMEGVPRVVGISTLQEVHEVMKVWREVQGDDDAVRKANEEAVRKVFRTEGWEDFSWQSPPLPGDD